MTPLHHLHERYDRSSKLSDEVHLFWTLTSSTVESSLSKQANGRNSDVNEIQFAIAYNLPNLALHDHNINDEDEQDLVQTHLDNIDNLHEDETKEHTKDNNYWLAFGISPQGGMIGADFMIYLPHRHSQQQQEPLLLDAHGIQYSFPIVDSCGQDWTLLNSSVIVIPNEEECSHPCEGCNSTNTKTECDTTTSWHILQVKRALSSNDVNEDVPFLNDSSVGLTNPTFVLAAWGKLKNGVERESDGRRRRTEHDRSLVEAASDGDDDVSSLDLTSVILPHGPLQRVSTTVRFFDEAQPESDDGNDDSTTTTTAAASQAFYKMPYIDLIPNEPFPIPNDETTYKNFCFKITEYPQLTQLLNNQQSDDQTVHIVGFQNIIQAGSPVHHMDLHGTRSSILGADTRLCRVYMELIHPWEAGSPREFALPMEAGIPMGYENENVDSSSSSSNDGGGYKAFRLEVHYHNPHRRDGMLDQSGVRIYYSIKKREHVAGLMLLGDYMLKLRGSYTVGAAINDKDANSTTAIVANSSKEFGYGMKHSFYCPSSCFSKERLGRNSVVTVFREVLHMHKSGERMTNIHMDSNGTILRASEANYFDFSRGAGYGSRVNLPYQINEGDSFVTSCYFAKRGTTWGSSSGDEMCQTFMWYYPQEEDFSLTCGYADALTRKANDTLDPLGCEVSYDRKQVPFDMERVKLNELCQATEASKRPISIFDSTVDTRQEWPSLAQLVNRWKQSRMPVEPSTNLTTPSSITKAKSTQATLQEDCRLCPNGQRPTHPDTVIEGFSWTCDELDAAIPVLYMEPELLFFSISDVPKCEDYQSAFGNTCCSTNDDEGGELLGLQREYSFTILVLATLLTLIMMLIKRRRAQPVEVPVLEITSSPLA